MAKALNFAKVKKNYFTVTLPDEKETTLLICIPTKGVMDEILSLKDDLTLENMDADVIDELYELCVKIMNNNKGGIVVTKSALEESLDFMDIVMFIQCYTEFINEQISLKN